MESIEALCQLCCVPFGVARFRTAHEPPDAGWTYHAPRYQPARDAAKTCISIPGTGCSTVNRTASVEGALDWEEHLAGTGCTRRDGYSGARIGVTEMAACHQVRVLLRKGDEYGTDWQDEVDDEPWERETRYFLSGTGSGCPNDGPLGNFDRDRHAVTLVVASNVLGDNPATGLPVHPYCWEMFTRVSQRECGFVDVHGLWQFHRVEGGYENFLENFPRHRAIRQSNQRWWRHEYGSEWLAANPIVIPGLMPTIRARVIYEPSDEWFAMKQTLFLRPSQWITGSGGNDPMACLPAEVRVMILAHLPSRSIAAARQVFRSLNSLPNTIFRRLVLEDMPWFWEAATFPIGQTDWYDLYMTMKFVWSDIQGLKNRRRIWAEIGEIVRRIQSYRVRGEICGVTGWES